MRDLVIMPTMAQRRESLNMGEFAEEAIIVEEVTAPMKVILSCIHYCTYKGLVTNGFFH